MPSAIVRIDGSGTGVPAASDAGHAAAPCGLHPDHPRRRAGSALTATAMPAIRPPPPVHDHDRAHVRALLEDLQPDRALAGDDVGVVERVDEHRAGPVGELAAPRRALSSTVAPTRCTVGAVPPGRGDLRQRRARSGMNTVAEMPSSRAASATPCAWLPALAATTPRARSLGVEPGDPRVRAADLERPGALQVLALQPHRAAEQLGQGPRARHRRLPRRHRRAAHGRPARRRGRRGGRWRSPRHRRSILGGVPRRCSDTAGNLGVMSGSSARLRAFEPSRRYGSGVGRPLHGAARRVRRPRSLRAGRGRRLRARRRLRDPRRHRGARSPGPQPRRRHGSHPIFTPGRPSPGRPARRRLRARADGVGEGADDGSHPCPDEGRLRGAALP